MTTDPWTLYKPCFACNGSPSDETPTGDCDVCHGRRFVPHGELTACEDHEVLDLFHHTLCSLPAYKTRGVVREADRVSFVDPVSNEAYEVVVRSIEHEQAPSKCRVCGCTPDDATACREPDGSPCHFVADDLCSKCMRAKGA